MTGVEASIIISAIGQGLNAAGNANASGVTLDVARLQNDYENARQQQRLQLSESGMDPFRQQMFQAKDLGRLGLMQRPGNPGVGAPPGGRYAQTGAPTMRPNTYAPSPELMQWLQAIQQNIAGGQNRAPSVTGWNATSALNLLDPATLANPGAAKGVDQTPPPLLYGQRANASGLRQMAQPRTRPTAVQRPT